ncbi:MAG: DNA-binding response regulator, partial [Dehalococcoidia bacterium]|nr:DNA-binding response regulator [Dehalococcoidia bacterium]
KIVGLELGADDYVTKPFNLCELVARIRAGLRRAAAEEEQDRTSASAGSGTAGETNEDAQADRLAFGALEVLPAERRVLGDGKEVSLTRTEFDLLLALASANGRVLTRDELVTAVWGYDSEGGTRLLDSHILHLRGKIEPDPRRPRFVLTVRDVGYRLNRQPQDA